MVLVGLLIFIGFVILNLVAIYKIITKAGYSGKWIAVVVAPFIAELIGFGVAAHDVHSGKFHAGNFALWFALAALLGFVEYILFLVFAFSNWPALRPRGYGYQAGYGYGGPRFPPPFGAGPRGRPPGTQSWRASSQPSEWSGGQCGRPPA